MDCPLCNHRVSEWEVKHDKLQVAGGTLCHKSCLIDYKLKHGFPYRAKPTCAECGEKLESLALVSWRGKRFHMDCFIKMLRRGR